MIECEHGRLRGGQAERHHFRYEIAGAAAGIAVIAVPIEHRLDAIVARRERREAFGIGERLRVDRDRPVRAEPGDVARRDRDPGGAAELRGVDLVRLGVGGGRGRDEDQQPAAIGGQAGGERDGHARLGSRGGGEREQGGEEEWGLHVRIVAGTACAAKRRGLAFAPDCA